MTTTASRLSRRPRPAALVLAIAAAFGAATLAPSPLLAGQAASAGTEALVP